MRQLITLLVAVLLTVSEFLPLQVSAQAPQKMNYQAIIRNSNDQLVTDQLIGVQISILQGSATGTIVYFETQTPTTNANGLINIEVGDEIVFDTINWANGPYFIKTEIDPKGGTNCTITGTTQLLSVPYALHTKTAERVTGTIIETDPIFVASPAYGITSGYISIWNNKLDTEVDGSTTNEIQNLSNVLNQNNDGNGSQIKNIANPTDKQDAATKAYIDNLLIKIGDLDKLLSVGFTVQQLFDGGHSISDLLSAGVSVSDIMSAGASVSDLFDLGVGVGTLEQSGATEQALNDAGLIGTIEDADGNSYKWIKIGAQVWMAENLKTTKYNNGTTIPLVTDNTAWNILTTPGYCWFDNNETTYKITYGALYNWYTVNTGNLCPSNWHVPSDTEWTTLTTYLGGENITGGKLKESGLAHWTDPNTDATNESGFTALPGGDRGSDGKFYRLGTNANFWSATANDNFYAWRRTLNYNSSYLLYSNFYYKSSGYSIRCLKD